MVEELNVLRLETCDQPLQYARLRGDPDWRVGHSFLHSSLLLWLCVCVCVRVYLARTCSAYWGLL